MARGPLHFVWPRSVRYCGQSRSIAISGIRTSKDNRTPSPPESFLPPRKPRFSSIRIFLIIEYAPNGEVYKQLTKTKGLDDKRAATYIYQMCVALQYCPSNKPIHKNIEPENLLLGFNGELKMADFSWSVHLETSISAADPPPEIVESDAHDEKVDTWSFLVAKPPIESVMTVDSHRRTRTIDLRFSDDVSEPVRNLITVVPGTRLRDWCVCHRTPTAPLKEWRSAPAHAHVHVDVRGGRGGVVSDST
ncbi:hypothetical protein HPB47_010899 [Ixodes persulcatus]|uniref:Uncharacterized protein n=1 Tax=Ixodes persulcatus TaxID=34615 RepID=A0AC60NXS9_IXOPE|nr:hypothetical protein HPB47_010899 [Ixodes persulcatus]